MEYGIESDHSTLVWNMKLFKEVYNQDNKSANQIYKEMGHFYESS